MLSQRLELENLARARELFLDGFCPGECAIYRGGKLRFLLQVLSRKKSKRHAEPQLSHCDLFRNVRSIKAELITSILYESRLVSSLDRMRGASHVSERQA